MSLCHLLCPPFRRCSQSPPRLCSLHNRGNIINDPTEREKLHHGFGGVNVLPSASGCLSSERIAESGAQSRWEWAGTPPSSCLTPGCPKVGTCRAQPGAFALPVTCHPQRNKDMLCGENPDSPWLGDIWFPVCPNRQYGEEHICSSFLISIH